jgi:hypothetical protein
MLQQFSPEMLQAVLCGPLSFTSLLKYYRILRTTSQAGLCISTPSSPEKNATPTYGTGMNLQQRSSAVDASVAGLLNGPQKVLSYRRLSAIHLCADGHSQKVKFECCVKTTSGMTVTRYPGRAILQAVNSRPTTLEAWVQS